MKKTNLKETLKQIVGVLLFGYVCIAEAVSTGCKKLRTLPKKVMAVCIAAALIVAMVPVYVFAAGIHTNHCVCGGNAVEKGEHTSCNDTQTWTAWDANESSNYQTTLPTSGTYYLTDNVTLSSQHTVNGKLTICLNGNTISLTDTATTGSVIVVSSGSTFELTDCSSTAGQITGGKGYKFSYFQPSGGGVYNDGTFTMYGGIIAGNTASSGGGVYNAGTFTMYDGTIGGQTENEKNHATSSHGGGVYNYSGTFVMNGGTIIGNSASSFGGGVCNYNSGTFTMTGGTITGNRGNYGGGVYNSNQFNLSGNPVINGNHTYSEEANNVYLYKTITVNGTLTGADKSIGITMQNGSGKFTSGGAAYASKFITDNSAYIIAVDGENLALKSLYTVTFNYGTLGSETKKVLGGETVTPPTPVFAGKVLVGWFADDTYQNAFDPATPITADTTVYAKFADYEDDKAALQDAIDALEADVTELNKLTENGGTIDQINANISAIESKVLELVALKNKYAEADTALKQELQAADAAINAAIAALTTRVQDLEAGLADANSKINTNTSDVGTLKSDIADLKTWKTEAQDAINALKTLTGTQGTDIANLKLAVQSLEAELAAANARIDDIEDKIAVLEGKVSALETAKQELDAAVAALNAAIANKADTATLNQKVSELNAAITAAQTAAKTYADEKDTALKTELEGKISTAQAAAISAAEALVNNAKAELQDAINGKADIGTLNTKVSELNAAIATAEATAKAYTDSAVTTLNAAIITAKDEAVNAAKDLVDAAKAELQAAIDNKADTATVNAAIANLQNAITALQNAKDNYIAADAALKAELEDAIAKAKQEAIDAAKGHIPYIGTNGNWWIGDTDTGVDANGIKGDKGDKGDTGADGVGIAKIEKTATNGNVDTYTVTLTNGKTYTFTVTNGKDGANGKDGENGKDGLTPFIGENGNWWIGDTDTGVKAAADDSIPVGSGNVTEAEGVNTVTVVAIVIASLALLGNVLLAVLVLKKKKSLV